MLLKRFCIVGLLCLGGSNVFSMDPGKETAEVQGTLRTLSNLKTTESEEQLGEQAQKDVAAPVDEKEACERIGARYQEQLNCQNWKRPYLETFYSLLKLSEGTFDVNFLETIETFSENHPTCFSLDTHYKIISLSLDGVSGNPPPKKSLFWDIAGFGQINGTSLIAALKNLFLNAHQRHETPLLSFNVQRQKNVTENVVTKDFSYFLTETASSLKEWLERKDRGITFEMSAQFKSRETTHDLQVRIEGAFGLSIPCIPEAVVYAHDASTGKVKIFKKVAYPKPLGKQYVLLLENSAPQSKEDSLKNPKERMQDDRVSMKSSKSLKEHSKQKLQDEGEFEFVENPINGSQGDSVRNQDTKSMRSFRADDHQEEKTLASSLLDYDEEQEARQKKERVRDAYEDSKRIQEELYRNQQKLYDDARAQQIELCSEKINNLREELIQYEKEEEERQQKNRDDLKKNLGNLLHSPEEGRDVDTFSALIESYSLRIEKINKTLSEYKERRERAKQAREDAASSAEFRKLQEQLLNCQAHRAALQKQGVLPKVIVIRGIDSQKEAEILTPPGEEDIFYFSWAPKTMSTDRKNDRELSELQKELFLLQKTDTSYPETDVENVRRKEEINQRLREIISQQDARKKYFMREGSDGELEFYTYDIQAAKEQTPISSEWKKNWGPSEPENMKAFEIFLDHRKRVPTLVPLEKEEKQQWDFEEWSLIFEGNNIPPEGYYVEHQKDEKGYYPWIPLTLESTHPKERSEVPGKNPLKPEDVSRYGLGNPPEMGEDARSGVFPCSEEIAEEFGRSLEDRGALLGSADNSSHEMSHVYKVKKLRDLFIDVKSTVAKAREKEEKQYRENFGDRESVRSLTIHRISKGFLTEIINIIPGAPSFLIPGLSNLSSLTLRLEDNNSMNSEDVKKILTCPNLKSFVYSGLFPLKSGDDIVGYMTQIMESHKGLIKFELPDGRGVSIKVERTKDGSLKFSNFHQEVTIWPQTVSFLRILDEKQGPLKEVKHLTFGGFPFVFEALMRDLLTRGYLKTFLLKKCPDLESLHFLDCFNGRENLFPLEFFGEDFPLLHLKELEIHNSHLCTFENEFSYLRGVLFNFPNLKKLVLQGHFSQEELEDLMVNLRKLKLDCLDLSGTHLSRISGDFLYLQRLGTEVSDDTLEIDPGTVSKAVEESSDNDSFSSLRTIEVAGEVSDPGLGRAEGNENRSVPVREFSYDTSKIGPGTVSDLAEYPSLPRSVSQQNLSSLSPQQEESESPYQQKNPPPQSLKELILRNCFDPKTDGESSFMRNLSLLRGLIHLDLSSNDLTRCTREDFACLPMQLEELILRNCFKEQTILLQTVSDLLELFENLKLLDLSQNPPIQNFPMPLPLQGAKGSKKDPQSLSYEDFIKKIKTLTPKVATLRIGSSENPQFPYQEIPFGLKDKVLIFTIFNIGLLEGGLREHSASQIEQIIVQRITGYPFVFDFKELKETFLASPNLHSLTLGEGVYTWEILHSVLEAVKGSKIRAIDLSGNNIEKISESYRVFREFIKSYFNSSNLQVFSWTNHRGERIEWIKEEGSPLGFSVKAPSIRTIIFDPTVVHFAQSLEIYKDLQDVTLDGATKISGNEVFEGLNSLKKPFSLTLRFSFLDSLKEDIFGFFGGLELSNLQKLDISGCGFKRVTYDALVSIFNQQDKFPKLETLLLALPPRQHNFVKRSATGGVSSGLIFGGIAAGVCFFFPPLLIVAIPSAIVGTLTTAAGAGASGYLADMAKKDVASTQWADDLMIFTRQNLRIEAYGLIYKTAQGLKATLDLVKEHHPKSQIQLFSEVSSEVRENNMKKAAGY